MSTPLLKRRLNPFLIASTVLVLSLLAGLSVMYQGQLSDLVGDKKDLKSELEQKNQRLSDLQAENSNLTSKLENTQGDLGKYSRLYQQTRQERNNLRDEVSNLESDIEDKNGKIDTLEGQISSVRDNLTDTRTDFRDLCADDGNNMTSDSETICNVHFEDY